MESPHRTDYRPAVWTCRALLAGFFILITIPVFTRPSGDWELVYLSAAGNLREGRDLLEGNNAFVYPPFGALFAVPFTFLPRPAALVAWAAVNALAGAVFLVGAWRLAGGRGLPGRANTTGADYAAFWFGMLLAIGFLLDSAANWQTDLIIGAVLIAGCVLLARERSLAAGIAFGAAAAFKCTPLLFAPYLLWKRRFVAAAAVPIAAIGLNFLPDLIYPPTDGKPRAIVWKERFLTPMAGTHYDPGAWASAVGFNHSLAGVNLRWLAYERTQNNDTTSVAPRADRPSATDLKRLNLGITAMFGLLALIALWRRPAEISPGPVFAAELGIVFTLMLLLSPMSSKPHFVLLLLPQLAIVRAGWNHRDRLLIALAALVAIGGLCTGKDIVGRTAYEFLIWNGLVFFLTVALFLGCCHVRYWYAKPGERSVRPTAQPATAQRNAA